MIQEERGIGPPRHKSKDWVVEFKWNDKKSYERYHWGWEKTGYVDEWKADHFGSKFTSLNAAIDSLHAKIKKARTSVSHDMSRRLYEGDLYKKYRVRNLKTGDITEYEY